MSEEINRKTYFAKADYRGKEQVFGIKALDRSKHVYVIGKTGMGKTVLLQNMAVQDIQNGNGMAFIDPHGEVTAAILDYIPEERVKDVIHFAPFDANFPISFNVMEDVGYDKRHLVVSGLISTFKKIWPDVWSARMEYILSNTLFALLEYPDSTLLDVNRMLINKDFRKAVVERITDPVIKSFWVEEFAKYTDRYTQEATPAIQNKIGQFVSNPLIRNIIGQPKSSFDFREAMDSRKILIINLSKGRIGDTNSKLIGSMLIIKIYLAAMSRADTLATELAKLPPFYFFVDEFQSFANETFADILSESRKYKLSLTIAHQYIGQMPEEVRDAVFGNVGTIIVFRVGATDAEVLESEFSPTFTAEDLVNLGYYQIYLKLMIDGLASKPFSAVTLPPIEKLPRSFKPEIVAYSRETYARPRAEVEVQILERHIIPTPSPETRERVEKSYRDSRDGGRPAYRGSTESGPRPEWPSRNFNEPERRRPVHEERRDETRRPRFSEEASSHRPFKKTFNEMPRREERVPYAPQQRRERENAQRVVGEKRQGMSQQAPAPVSLNTLRPRAMEAKEPTPENTEELRKTLKEALRQSSGQALQEKNQEVRIKNQEAVKEKPDITAPIDDGSSVEKKIPEIPEDELKKMLDMGSSPKDFK